MGGNTMNKIGFFIGTCIYWLSIIIGIIIRAIHDGELDVHMLYIIIVSIIIYVVITTIWYINLNIKRKKIGLLSFKS
jgi:hypothetical protein